MFLISKMKHFHERGRETERERGRERERGSERESLCNRLLVE